jgi:uncharacterized protein YkwD
MYFLIILNLIIEILKYTNLERNKLGLKSLAPDTTLNSIAILRADDILANQYFEHDSLNKQSYLHIV